MGRLKGTPEAQTVETELTLGLPAHIPASYIEDGRERLRCYKMLTSATGGAAREEAALGIRDRFGPRITSYNVCYTKLLRAVPSSAHSLAV